MATRTQCFESRTHYHMGFAARQMRQACKVADPPLLYCSHTRGGWPYMFAEMAMPATDSQHTHVVARKKEKTTANPV